MRNAKNSELSCINWSGSGKSPFIPVPGKSISHLVTKETRMSMHLTEQGEWKIDPPDNNIETLRSLCEKHPDWMDLPIGVYVEDGSVDFVGDPRRCLAIYFL
jgi:hypothetical protein